MFKLFVKQLTLISALSRNLILTFNHKKKKKFRLIHELISFDLDNSFAYSQSSSPVDPAIAHDANSSSSSGGNGAPVPSSNINHNINNNPKLAAIAFTNPVYNLRKMQQQQQQQQQLAVQQAPPRTTFMCNGYDAYDAYDANGRLPMMNTSPNNNRFLLPSSSRETT